MPMEIIQNENQLSILSDERITAEILIYKDQVGYGMIELGKRLIEMKKRLGHGKWLPYLREKVEFTQPTASKFMRIAEECSNQKSTFNLGTEKLYALLDVPSEDREEFINTPHQVETKNGTVEKTVEQMTVREVEQVIKLQKELAEKDELLQQEKEHHQRLNLRINNTNNTLMETRKAKEKILTELNEKDKLIKKLKTEVRTEYQEIVVESPELKARLAEKERELADIRNQLLMTKSDKASASNLESEIKDLKRQLDVTKQFYNEELSITENQRQEIEALQEQINRNNSNNSGITEYFKKNIKIFVENQIMLLDTLSANSNEITYIKDQIINILKGD